MNDMQRYIKMDDWFFEIKTVRALRTKNYGDKYSAIANINCNGDAIYIDGLMTADDNPYTFQDLQTFKQFCRKMGAKTAHFDRFKNDQLRSQSVIIQPEKPQSILKLVK
ncbi:hypothetical protein [Thalassotalea sp. SU-HH00458]|uniref:hypothetical protein n=1 Tax=Thalassotalea sp. SU-HH00458 TaxID=3127657 RepID=UPI00310AF119